jgi:hypothetical protein
MLRKSRSIKQKSTGPDMGETSPRSRYTIVIAVNFGFWLVATLYEWIAHGLFIVLGGDWARFWAAARAYDAGGPRDGYRLSMIAAFMQPLVQYARPEAGGIRAGPAPYPPIFMELFSIFTLPDPPIGFLLWTALNAALALLVLRRLAGQFRTDSPWAQTFVMLGCFPLMIALFAGQVVVLLLACLSQAVAEFERGRELRAGVWCGLLVLKPQYAFCLVLVFLIKRRTAATTGFALGSSAILAASIAVGGTAGLIAYGEMLITSYPTYDGGTGIDPKGMIGWRGLVATGLPWLGTVPSLLLVASLSLLTLALLPLIWRGSWDPSDTRFHGQIMATVASTLLVAYHSHPHGAALLLVPGSLIVARASGPPVVRSLLVGAMIGAPVLGGISAFALGNLSLIGLATSGVLVVVLVTLAYAEIASRAWGEVAGDAGMMTPPAPKPGIAVFTAGSARSRGPTW